MTAGWPKTLFLSREGFYSLGMASQTFQLSMRYQEAVHPGIPHVV